MDSVHLMHDVFVFRPMLPMES